MAAASGDFRALSGTFEVSDIDAENAVEVIEQLIRKEYSFTLQRTLPQRFEQALFSGDRRTLEEGKITTIIYIKEDNYVERTS
eukprot:2606857-Amphidinium_carterae.1